MEGGKSLLAWLKNAKLAFSIFAVCVVPLLVVLTYSAATVMSNIEQLSRAERIDRFVGAVPDVAALITALQRERGMSVGFVRSQGASFASERQAQIGGTDEALRTYAAAQSVGGLTVLGAHSASALANVQKGLDSLAATRANATALAIEPAALGTYYTGLIANLIGLIEVAYYAADDGRIKTQLDSYLSLLRGIEVAGQERAAGTAILASGSVPVADALRLGQFGAAQRVLFEQFRRLADADQQAFWDRTQDEQAVAGLQPLRDAIAKVAGTTEPATVATSDWFRASTARIDRLYAVAAEALEHFVAIVRSVREGAAAAMQAALVEGVAASLLSLCFALYIASVISRSLNRITAAMTAIAEDRFDTAVPFTDRRNELGAMAKAVEVFRENGLRIAHMTQAEAARIIRDQQARTQMMNELQRAFGDVVDAAVGGDFGKRVETEFPDPELNAIATSINNLVTTVDEGLSETSAVLAALARTDLTHRVSGNYEGAFARLKADTNEVAEKLSEIVGQLKQTSRTLKTATGEILSGANDLSERTTKQAAAIEETSAAMEQLASTVMQNAERASEASEVAGTVTRTAEEGGQVMTNATQAMERITASSGKISNIIGLIDDIAFQTNLLALNASVEAARAGEAGKGFAVVAVEVRRLAQSAAQASSEVKALIEQSGTEVRNGSKLVADAASRLAAMLTAARNSSGLMDGIARESREQAASIEEVNAAVRQMDEMTQHNAALVEETNAAIEQTESQARELDRIVDVFTIAEQREARDLRAPRARIAA
jgi:methyl-accepting chemotaxis protein